MSAREPMAPPPDCGHDAAPYLLGALEPDETRAFERHMVRCAVCRDEVAALAPVLDALPAAAPAHPPPRALRRRVLHAVRAEPKPTAVRVTAAPGDQRRRLTAAPWRALKRSAPAGWLALGATMAAAAVIVHVGAPHPRAHTVPARVGEAQLRLSGNHGELIVERLPRLPADRTYELWVQRGRARPVPSTLFAVTTRGTADIGVPTDLRGATRLLVTVEPRGGSLIPTTPAVIQIAFGRVPPHTPST